MKMSDYGFIPGAATPLAVNARGTMGGLFLANPRLRSDEARAGIFENLSLRREANATG